MDITFKETTMLGSKDAAANIAVKDLAKARKFPPARSSTASSARSRARA